MKKVAAWLKSYAHMRISPIPGRTRSNAVLAAGFDSFPVL